MQTTLNQKQLLSGGKKKHQFAKLNFTLNTIAWSSILESFYVSLAELDEKVGEKIASNTKCLRSAESALLHANTLQTTGL